MSNIQAWLKSNAAGIAGWLATAVAAWLLQTFGLEVTDDQKAALTSFFIFILGLTFTIVSNVVKSRFNPLNVSTKELRNNPAAAQGTGDGGAPREVLKQGTGTGHSGGL